VERVVRPESLPGLVEVFAHAVSLTDLHAIVIGGGLLGTSIGAVLIFAPIAWRELTSPRPVAPTPATRGTTSGRS
jgi:hypothetical protein